MTELPFVLHLGKSQEILKGYPDNHFDSVVCDPPYHLTSIVKRFGKADAAPAQFGTDGAFARASRGFMGKEWDGGDIAFRPEFWAEVYRVLKPGGHLLAFSGSRTYHRMACGIEEAGFEIRDQIMWLYGSGFPKSHDVSKGIDRSAGAEHEVVGMERNYGVSKAADGKSAFGDYAGEWSITAPATPAAKQWQGWGTALKPAHEPICVARKPLDGTVVETVLRWGTGAINVDGCRVGSDDGIDRSRPTRTPNKILGGGKGTNLTSSEHNDLGRWPANIIHDGSDEVVAVFPGDDGSSPARFFYCPKANKRDRDEGLPDGERSTHPTVKPTDLMRYLCRLVTPPGGVVLDPFMGSGSTGKAAMLEGFRFVGIDMTEEYHRIAEARIRHALRQVQPKPEPEQNTKANEHLQLFAGAL